MTAAAPESPEPPELDDVYTDDIVRRIDRQLAEPLVGRRGGGGSVAGVALTAALLRGVADAIDADDADARRWVEVEPGRSAKPQAVEVFLAFHDPRQSRALVRPWLL